MSQKTHWEKVYATRETDRVGWYKPHLQTSFNWIDQLGLEAEAPIIDVGCGASTLVDDLLQAGHNCITVLDISQSALTALRKRLGRNGESVTYINADVTAAELPMHHYAVWHDRAAFHFLTSPDQQALYRDKLLQALKPDGHLIIGVFSPEAPPKCSGLPVQRYTQEQFSLVLGNQFELQRCEKELHVTPGGVEQMYLYCHYLRKA